MGDEEVKQKKPQKNVLFECIELKRKKRRKNYRYSISSAKYFEHSIFM